MNDGGCIIVQLHDTPLTRLRPRFLAIALAAAVFILYVSFYPFHFSRRPGSPLENLLATFASGTGRGDLIANVLLYVPLGFFAAYVVSRFPRPRHLLLVTSAAASLSFTIELVQFYDQSRVSSLADVYANTAGALAGATAAIILSRHADALLRQPEKRHLFVLLLLGCWLTYQLFPFVPMIDAHKYWRAVKPLILAPKLAPGALYRHFVTGLTVAALLAEWRGLAISRLLAPACLAGVLCARITITGLTLSAAEVVGSLAAAVCWAALFSRLRTPVALTAGLLAFMIALQSLAPFHFVPAPHPFGWIPFRSMLQGSISTNVLSIFEKAFEYGSLVWLLERSGWRLWTATAVSAAFVLVLRLCQCYLPERSAEITDALIVVLLAGVMSLLPRAPRCKRPSPA